MSAGAEAAQVDLPMVVTEAEAELISVARRAAGPLAEGLARHVMTLYPDAGWAVQEAAMAALLRRLASAQSEGLAIQARPPGGHRLGAYTTRRRGRGQGARPYLTVLHGVAPMAGSCDCPDYVRASLGLCKHLLTVLVDLARGARKWGRAEQEQGALALGPLTWDPVRPLTGLGDRLSGLRWSGPERARGAEGKAAVWFEGGAPAGLEALSTKRRLALVQALRPVARGAGRRASLQPGLLRVLDEEEARLLARLADQDLAKRVPALTRGLGRTLYPYQVEGVQAALRSGRLLLADDMGLGKTVQATAFCVALVEAKRARRGLLIVPASLKSQWLREWQATTSVPAEVVEGDRHQRRSLYRRRGPGFLIMNYELLLKDLVHVQAFRPDIVVLDEAQRIKNWATKTAAFVKALTPRYRLVLTGTPMENRLDELASIFDWVDDVALEPKWRLLPVHTVRGASGEGRGAIVGAQHLETLRARTAGAMVRRVRQQVLDQLPPRTDVRVPVGLTPQQVEAHEELALPVARLIAMARRRPLAQPEFLRLMALLNTQRAICNGMALVGFEQLWPTLGPRVSDEQRLEGLDTPKLSELRRLVRELVVEQGRKVVVFSQWRRMLRLARWATEDLLAQAGLTSAFFTGAESQARRTENVIGFHDDPDLRILFLSDAGGVGLNLQRAATACINLELPWNPAVLEQRIGRIHRLGQTSPIDVFNLVSEGGIESRIAGLLGAKKALFQGLFDGTSDQVLFEDADSVMSKLERLVEPVVLPPPLPAEEGGDEVPVAPEEAALVRSAEEGADPPPELGSAGRAAGAGGQAHGDGAAGPGPAEREPPAGPTPARPAGPEVAALLRGLQVRPTPSGGLTIEAPPEAAATLAQLFETMAALLRGAAE